jgi:DNA-binding HxlR family transcriptional regulator
MKYGIARFNVFIKDISGSPTTITERLRELCQAGILQRISYAEIPPRVEYTLTEKGEDLAPIIEKIQDWGDKWE